jgi:DNA-directed RNA polymerase specialized sigma24 family protein
MVKEWVMNHDDFDRFLAWLHPDRDEAAEKYEKIRRRLTKIFESHGCAEADDLADETFDRVVRKVPEVADSYVGDPALYCYGVGRKVRLERCHRSPVPPPLPPPDHWDEREPRYTCLDECMMELPPEDRQLALSYYADEGRTKIERRQKLAEGLGGSNALRIRMYRIRAALHGCIDDCLKARGQ